MRDVQLIVISGGEPKMCFQITKVFFRLLVFIAHAKDLLILYVIIFSFLKVDALKFDRYFQDVQVMQIGRFAWRTARCVFHNQKLTQTLLNIKNSWLVKHQP